MKIRAALIALVLIGAPAVASAQDPTTTVPPVPVPILDDVSDLPEGEGRASKWPRTEAAAVPETAPAAAPAPAAPTFTG